MPNVINATSTGNGGLITQGDDSGILNIQTNETTAITVDASQNVGIGTTSPVAKLDVSSSSAGVTAGDLVVDTTNKVVYVGRQSSTSGDNAKLVVRNRVGDALTITGDTSPDGTGLYRPTTSTLGFTTAGTERMRINSSGTISYGTSNAPSNALFRGYGNASAIFDFGSQTSGSAFVVFNTGGTGVYLTSGNTSWTGVSDERLKTDLNPIENALNKVNQLRSVTGRFKTDAEGTSRSFLIAQDVQAVLPEAVDATDPEKLGVQYTEVIPLLVAAIKELKTINDTQAETINALTARIVALEGQ